MVIDLEHHLEPREVWEKRGGKPGQVVMQRAPDGTPLRPLDDSTHDIQIHLKYMDLAGIDLAVLSCTEADSLEEARLFNNHFASVVKQFPDRFSAFGVTMPLGGKPALAELERAVQGLGLKGVTINAVTAGLPVDSRQMWPFYETVAKLNVPIFVHPSVKLTGFEALQAPYDLFRTIGREFDLALATFRLCAGGVLNDFPDLKVIVAHFGGGFSSVKERMDRYIKVMGPAFWSGKPLIKEPYFETYQKYFDRLFFNTAGREIGPQTLQCALTNIQPERMLFGTDYPPNFSYDAEGMRKWIQAVRNLPLARASIEGILSTNARQLLGIN